MIPVDNHARRLPRNYETMALYAICTLIFAFLMFPILLTIPMSFSPAVSLQFPPHGFSLRWYQKYFTNESWVNGTVTSIKVAITTMILATGLGILASFGLVRGKFPGKDIVYAIIISPMIIPSIILAIALYRMFGKLHLVGNPLGLTLAHTVLAIPFVVVNVSATLKGFDETLEQAAMSLGAARFKTIWYITFPIIRPGLITGALFAFITSFDEAIVAIFLSGLRAYTLPKRMWDSFTHEMDPVIAAASTLLILLSILLLSTVELLRRRSERLKSVMSDE